MKYNKFFSIVNLVVIFYIISYKFFSIFNFQFSLFSFRFYQIAFIYLFISAIVLIIRFFFQRKNLIKNNFILFFLIFLILIYLSFHVIFFNYYDNLNASLINVISFPLIYLVGFSSQFNRLVLSLSTFFSIILILVISYVYFNFHRDYNIYLPGMLSLSVNSIYYIVFLLPFLFQIRSKFLFLFFLILAVSVVIFSNKATPLIGILLFVFVYSFNYIKIPIAFKLLFTFITLLVLSLLFFIFLPTLNYDLYMKIYSYLLEGDNPRLNFIEAFFNSLSEVNLLLLFFGKGYNQSVVVFGISFHNDYLETLYSFGIIGFTLYFFFFLTILKTLRKSYKRIFVFVFLFMILGTHYLFVPTYSGLFSAYLGFNNE